LCQTQYTKSIMTDETLRGLLSTDFLQSFGIDRATEAFTELVRAMYINIQSHNALTQLSSDKAL